MAIFLIVMGLAVGGMATFGFVYMVGLGCGMGPTGCRSSLISLYFRHLFDPEGIVYLMIMAVSAAVLIAGIRLRRS